ncbi:GNAT family N-acetyltransferase [Streptomyces chartreusis]
MAYAGPSRLRGLSLHLVGWKGDPRHRWPGRQVVALIQGRAAGHVEFYLHPDGLALEVSYLEVSTEFRNLGLASLLMDRMYEAHPASPPAGPSACRSHPVGPRSEACAAGSLSAGGHRRGARLSGSGTSLSGSSGPLLRAPGGLPGAALPLPGRWERRPSSRPR